MLTYSSHKYLESGTRIEPTISEVKGPCSDNCLIYLIKSYISLAVEFAVKLSLHDGNSYQEIPANDSTYTIERGQSLVLFCNVTSITWPQRTWSKRTYQGYETVQSQEFQPEFSSSGFGWTSTINIPQFNYTDSGNYSCSGAAGSNYGIDYATLYINGK